MASFNRPPRLQSPLPNQTVKMPKIPALAAKTGSSGWIALLMPFIAIVISAVIMLAFSGGSSSMTSYLLFIPVMALSSLAGIVVAVQQRKEAAKKSAAAHTKLKNEITAVEKTLADLSQEERKKRLRKDPDIAECLKRVKDVDPRLGERRPGDEDFLHVRFGSGSIPASYQIQEVDFEQDSDEFKKEVKELKEISNRFKTIPDAPFLVRIPQIGSMAICGEESNRRNLVYSMICQVRTHQWPDEARIAIVCPQESFPDWKWITKAPHSSRLMNLLNRYSSEKDSKKIIAAMMKDLELELQEREQTYEAKKLIKHEDDKPSQVLAPLPRLVVIFDNVESVYNHPAVSLLLEKGKELGVYAVFLTDHSSRVPGGCAAVMSVQDKKLLYKESGINTVECDADLTSLETMEIFADAFAAIPFPTGGGSSQPPESLTFLQLFNARRLDDIPVEEWWRSKSPYGYLRAPIGRTSPTSDWIFDLNDRDGAHGPHGLLGGMTGSGKSEALKTLILALAVTHHPYDLNFALVDFKGGAAFNELRNLPHTVGVITDIESNATFAERVIQSLSGEIERRKRILEGARSTFRFGRSHIDDYAGKLRTRRPLPRLLVVFDEFAEFKARNPEESKKLIGIARQGRSLGVHLLLATQNIATAIDAEIMQNSTYRICLRVSDPQDSVQMIGIPDAVSLKRGRAYFSVTSRVLFQSAYSGAEYIPENLGESVPNAIVRIHPDGRREVVSMLAWKNPDQAGQTAPPATEAAAVVEYLSLTASQMGLKLPPSVWQDALPDRLYLQDVLDENISGGWDGKTWLPCHPFTNREKTLTTVYPFLGIYDDPHHQCRPSFHIDPLQGGHILIFGSAGSGKSTLLRTMVTSLVSTHTPAEVQIYALDYGGQPRLKILEAFPHVGAVVTRLEVERTERLVSYLTAEMLRRNKLMREEKVDSWLDYNAQVKPSLKFPAVFLIIDNFMNLRDTFEPEMIKKVMMLTGAQSAGIHLAISAFTQSDLPNELLANINSRISFYQASDAEYNGLVGIPSEARKQEDAMLGMRPGRGLLRSTPPLSFQAALPIHGANDKELADNLTDLANFMSLAWAGKQKPPEICILEEHIYLPPASMSTTRRDYLAETGITYKELKPVGFSLREDGNAFLVSSTSPGDGKTTFLQMWLLRLAEMYSPAQLEIKIIGYHSQSMTAFKSLPHAQYIKVKPALQDFLADMGKVMDKRRKMQEKLIRDDAEKFDQGKFLDQFPQILVVIDDYAKFSSSTTENEQTQLLDLIQIGDENGLGMIISETMVDFPKSYNDKLIGKFSSSGCGVLLGGADGIDLYNNARITPGQPYTGLPHGRGYFIRRGRVSLFQAGVWWQEDENPVDALDKRLSGLKK
jgi:DNA segregation ATPase FtsK/SpoIIIE, S-DNA-T family